MYQLPPESGLRQNQLDLSYCRFFSEVLKTPLKNCRNSWGAQNHFTRTVFSNVWADRPASPSEDQQFFWFRSLDGRYRGRRLPGSTERTNFMEQLQTNPDLQHYGLPIIDPRADEKDGKPNVWGYDKDTLLILARKPVRIGDHYAIEVVGTRPTKEVVAEMASRASSAIEKRNHQEFLEGLTQQVTVEQTIRSDNAVRACIEHFHERDGELRCQHCGWTRPDGYTGRIIEIHHKEPVAERQREGVYAVDPIIDLVPLCPTCHRLAHDKSGLFPLQ